MIKRTFTILYHFCWYAFAFIILSAAVLVTVIRLTLPEIGGYKNEIQSWVSEYMHYPVVIDEITAEWKGWTPHLYLKNIDLYSPDNRTLISTFDSAHLGIDPFASINKRELVPSELAVSGIELEFTRNSDGSISINNTNSIDTTGSNNTAMSSWLLKQKHIKLENANLTWHDKKKQKEKLEFTNAELELKTHKERLQINADITLPESGDLHLRMDVFGNILTSDWKGDIYFEAENVNPEKLLEDFEIKSTGGIANAKVWTNWNKSKLIHISSELHYSDFSLVAKEQSLSINNAKLNFSSERQKEKDWLLNINIEELQTENGNWPTSNLQLSIINNLVDKQYKGHFSYVKLQDITPFLLASELISEEAIDKFDWQSLKGELQNTEVFYDPAASDVNRLLLNTDFKKIDIATIDKQHAVYNLAGSMHAATTNNNIKLTINSNGAEVLLGSIYDKALPLSILNAELELINSDSVELLIKSFNIADGTISAKSSGKIRFDEKNSPFIDIVTHIDETDIEYLPKYLPKHSSAKFKKWFTNAMVSGKLLYGNLLFHGHAADFPFENSEGKFKAIFNIENATIDYNKKWAPIDQLTAEVIINNNDLNIISSSATFFDASVNDMTVNVNPLGSKKHTITVDSKISGHTTDVANFIKQSPLSKKQSFRALTENITGEMNLKLGLNIPIGFSKTTLDGLISFTDTTIESGLPGLALEKVNGDVYFTNQASWASDIDALYHGQPVKLTIPKIDQHKSDSKPYVISGTADKEFFISEFNSFFPALINSSQKYSNKLSGKTDWSLTVKQPKDTSKGKEIIFDTDMKGISVDLPYPIGKSANDSAPLFIKTKLNKLLIENINISYNNIYADFNINNKDDLTVKNILIGLGKPHPVIETSSKISIQGELEKFSTEKGGWLDYLTAGKKTAPAIKKAQNTINANLLIKNLDMFGNEFNDVNVDLSNPVNGWQILFDGEDIKGETNFITSKSNQLHAKLEKLTLKVSEDENKNQIVIDKIPELDINIDEFIFNENKLGKFSLLTNNIENGININNLSISKPGLDINATGEWTSIDDIDRSDFRATLKADTIGNMLGTFSFDNANIKNGQTNMEMNAHWIGTPMEFAMEKIDGVLDIKIEKGQLLDIDPSAGRLFGLLSIQTLPRRLTLDFTDLFNKGFAFDNITGSFSIQQGHAYTNNLEMIGPSADIIVSGRTGLSTEDYDQIATVTPKVSSGLPVASALFGPVGVGVGAVIYLAGEVFNAIPEKIDQILKQQYTITGSWHAPNIEKIKKEKDSG